MKLHFILIFIISIVTGSCINGQSQNYKLNTGEFAQKTEEYNNQNIIDVRTAEEFKREHLNNSVNIDWYSNDFANQISKLEKKTAVFVYCQSGSRSAAAAGKMRAMGFTEVYELNGGILKWKAEKRPVLSRDNSGKGMSLTEFEEILSTDKIVLVDFYAEWCIPCKKMEPYLNEISTEMSDKVIVTRINVDEHSALFNNLKLDAVPVLQIYKNKKLIWQHKGFITKDEVVKKLN